MKQMKKVLAMVLVLALSISMIPATNVQAAKKAKLNKKKVTLYVGKTVTLKLKNNKKKVKWSSSNKNVATVNKKGKVKAKRKGKAVITAKVGKKKYKCKVTVKKKPAAQPTVQATTTQQVTTTQQQVTTVPQQTTTAQQETTAQVTEEVTTVEETTEESTTVQETEVSTTEDYGDSGEDWILEGSSTKVYIKEYIGTDTEIVIPEKIQGKTVIGIRDNAFTNCAEITSVIIPGTVTSIGVAAFSRCSGLISVEMLEGVTSIGDYAFMGCSSLTNVEIPEGVTSIGSFAFDGCSSLTSIEIPEGVTNIGNYAFDGCSSLTSMEIPEGVINIGNGAFANCTNLSSITIPESMTSIGNGAFANCTNLSSITIPESMTSIGYEAFANCRFSDFINNSDLDAEANAYWGAMIYDSENNGIYVKDNEIIYVDPSITEVNIPYGVTAIGEAAFSGCTELLSVTIPDSVTTIGARAFYGCSKLSDIEISDSVTSIGEYAFFETEWLSNKKADHTYVVINGILIDATAASGIVTVIGPRAFEWSDVSYVTISEGVTSIESYAFNECWDLEGIFIAPSVTHISSNNPFDWCVGLHMIYGIKGSYAETYAEEHEYWFNGITAEEYGDSGADWIVEVSNSEVYIKEYIGKGTDLNIPGKIQGTTVVGITQNGFEDDISITGVIIPNSVISIGANAFSGCSSLTSITIPASVTSIGANAFTGCDNLTIIAKEGSYAETWAEENGYTVEVIPLEYVQVELPIEWGQIYDQYGTATITNTSTEDAGGIKIENFDAIREQWDGQARYLNISVEVGKTYKLVVDVEASPAKQILVQVASEYYDFIEEATYDSETGHIEMTFSPTNTLINITFAFGVMSGESGGTYDIELSNIMLYEVN